MTKVVRLVFTASLVHDVVNKLAIIVGHCDFLTGHLKEGSPCTQRVSAIRGIARETAEELNGYQYER
jgi:hypothetical protein